MVAIKDRIHVDHVAQFDGAFDMERDPVLWQVNHDERHDQLPAARRAPAVVEDRPEFL